MRKSIQLTGEMKHGCARCVLAGVASTSWCERSKNKSLKLLQPCSLPNFPHVSVFAVNASLMPEMQVFYVLRFLLAETLTSL